MFLNSKRHLIVLCLCIFHTIISAQNKSIILGRPTNNAITASVLFDRNVQFYVEYGTQRGIYPLQTPVRLGSANVPDEIDILNLTPNTRYFYRLRYKLLNVSTYTATPEYSFWTQRVQGSTFRFVIEADEHLYDKKGVRSLYQIALANEARDSADFMISLGDTFGDDHTPNTTTSVDMDSLHKDYLQYLGNVCHSMPFYFCLGNHEGENGYYLQQNPPNNIAVYGTQWRKYYYPNPYPNGFYTGNTTNEPYGIGQPENYYAWTWGDALFVVLDVYRDCAVNEKPQNWDWTIGRQQYDWLKTTLETSTARHKFVFAHHVRGQGRGAVAMARGFEWGGYNNSGVWQFNTQRPGWAMPIHQLMVTNGVKIFFQGHDHLFAKESLDSLVYQEVPMPSDSTYEIGVLANADAYQGVTLNGSGHLRVTVTPACVTVDYIRAYLPADTLNSTRRNREIAYSYTVGNCPTTSTTDIKRDDSVLIYPNPANDVLNVQTQNVIPSDRNFELYNLYGQLVQIQKMESGTTIVHFDVSTLEDGIYILKWENNGVPNSRKVTVVR